MSDSDIPWLPDVHTGYLLMVAMGIVVMFSLRPGKAFTNPEAKRAYVRIQIITIMGALAGSKLAVVMGDALWPLKPFAHWHDLLFTGRSIAGALLFGFLAAELAKPILRYPLPPNDRFAVLLPFSIATGRLGCYLVGCCRGLPWDGPWATTYSDGIPRHPAPVYEILFHLAIGLVLLRLWRKQQLFGRLFALYLASYGAFRFVSEFWRETSKAWEGFSAYQWLALAMVVCGLISLAARSRSQPGEWQQWKTQ